MAPPFKGIDTQVEGISRGIRHQHLHCIVVVMTIVDHLIRRGLLENQCKVNSCFLLNSFSVVWKKKGKGYAAIVLASVFTDDLKDFSSGL